MKREIRSSAVSRMAGVGAILDIGQESFLVQGIEHWKQNQLRVIELRRLSSRLRKVLKGPREERPSLMVRRFPKAMFCEKCRRMTMWRTDMEREGSEPQCAINGCDGTLVPMRFVVACENGHLDDVNWWLWAHSGPNQVKGCKAYDQLAFKVDTSVATGGLASVKVECDKCKSWRSLEDIANKNIVKEIFKTCAGGHPWIFGTKDTCAADVVVLQRGATNLHYPSTISALDIPVEVEESPAAAFAEQISVHPRFQRLVGLVKNTEGSNAEYIELSAENIATAVGCDVPVVLEVAVANAEGRDITGATGWHQTPPDQAILLDEEWRTIAAALQVGEMTSMHFAAAAEELAPTAPAWMKSLIDGVLLIRRLREVSAYLGFQRVKPSSSDMTVKPDVGAPQVWLPASEIFGEGIVLSLNFNLLEKWASQLPKEEREELALLEGKRLDENFWFLPQIDARFLALHTLSHLLLRRVTFECGYSSSSLRERLYFSPERRYAGIMIYTADGDSEGSLGGLVRQGRSDRIAQSISEALDQGQWCSSDPVCSETAGQGLGGFNHAACHACSLVSETSCTAANTLLDRRMLFEPSWGLLNFLGNRK